MNKLCMIAFGVLVVLFFVGIAGAVYPDYIPMGSNKEWPVANGVDGSQIFITAYNNSIPVEGLRVEYSLNRTDLGTISQTPIITGTNGVATSRFTSSTKSGTVSITAKIYYKFNQSDNNEIEKYTTRSLVQEIDHNTPVKLFKIAPVINGSEVIVGSNAEIIYQLKDQFDNNIDDRKRPITSNETIKFLIDNKPNATFSGTWMGTSYNARNVTLPINQTGFIVVNLITDSNPGLNTVHVVPQSTIPDSSFDIRGVAKGEPYRFTQSVYLNQKTIPLIIDPEDPPRLPADGISQFTFIYNVEDRFGNGIVGAPIKINISIAGEITKLTDNYGEVIVYVGPTDRIGKVNVSAYTTNASVKITNQTVSFVSTEPADMLLTADPQSMPSWDVPSKTKSTIIARVVDDSGDPVPGIPVNFSISGVTYAEVYHVVNPPLLEENSEVTNIDGEAIVKFVPGEFSTNTSDKDPLHPFDATATGYCYVNATWTNATSGQETNRSIALTWKNYPYISVETDVNPKLVNVSDTVDITLKLRGDGYALQPPPVDAVLVTDISGSMNSADKLPSTKVALKNFVGSANNKTYIGLVSYGNSPISGDYASADTITLWNNQVADPNLTPFNPYGSFYDRCLVDPATWDSYSGGYQNKRPDAKLDRNFTQVKSTLNTTIDGYSAVGGTNIAAGINGAMLMMNSSGVPGHKKVIIIMSDGIATMAPISPGSLKSYWPRDWFKRSDGQDQSITAINAALDSATRAKTEGIEVYCIGFGDVADTTNLSLIASTGKYYFAPNNARLNEIYIEIAGKIKTEASVQTQMDIEMGTVVVNGNTTENNAADPILEYQYVPGISTLINRRWISNNTPISVPVPNPNQNSTYWNINRTLHFDIGTMHLDEEYKATYRLQVLKDGNINLFGPGSSIKFLGADPMPIPDTYITSSYDLEKLAVNTTIEVLVSDFVVSDDDSGRHFASFNQTILKGVPTPPPTLEYVVEMNVGGMWVQIGTVTLTNVKTEKINFELFGYIPPGAQIRLVPKTQHMSVTPGDVPFKLPDTAYTTYGKSHINLK